MEIWLILKGIAIGLVIAILANKIKEQIEIIKIKNQKKRERIDNMENNISILWTQIRHIQEDIQSLEKK